MRSDIHAPVQVKAVRSESLHTGIEGEVLASLLLRMFDDGRFAVLVNGATLFDKKLAGRFPDYADDIKPRLASNG